MPTKSGNPYSPALRLSPLREFRTAPWDLPESEDLLTESITKELSKQGHEGG